MRTAARHFDSGQNRSWGRRCDQSTIESFPLPLLPAWNPPHIRQMVGDALVAVDAGLLAREQEALVRNRSAGFAAREFALEQVSGGFGPPLLYVRASADQDRRHHIDGVGTRDRDAQTKRPAAEHRRGHPHPPLTGWVTRPRST